MILQLYHTYLSPLFIFYHNYISFSTISLYFLKFLKPYDKIIGSFFYSSGTTVIVILLEIAGFTLEVNVIVTSPNAKAVIL